MWSVFDYTEFPIVHVHFIGSLKNDNDYYNFINKWIELYNQKKYFKFIFNTKECGYVNIKYTYKIASFIKKLKKQKTQYLQSSIIIYYSGWIKFLLRFVFSLQSPVANVYLVNGKNLNNDKIKDMSILPKDTLIYFPSLEILTNKK
jgi:hypothetical protein